MEVKEIFNTLKTNFNINLKDSSFLYLYAFVITNLILNILVFILDGIIIIWWLMAVIIAFIILFLPHKTE